MVKTKKATAPILENEQVKELLAVMKENSVASTKDFLAVLYQVGAMEKQLDAAVNELTAMRRELQEAQKENHPVKTAMQKAVISMQSQVLDLRDKLTELKQNVIEGCKNAVAAFKEKGVTALDNVVNFFKVRPMLENMRDNLAKDIQYDDKAIAKIEAISAEYHQAGRHVKNIGRAILGKEAAQEAKSSGKLAAAISYPFRAERSHLAAMKTSVEKAIGGIAKLEERAKPSIQKDLQKFSKQAVQVKKDAPETEKSHPTNAER